MDLLGVLEADGNGNFVGDIIVDTQPRSEDEEEYDEFEEEDYELEDEE